MDGTNEQNLAFATRVLRQTLTEALANANATEIFSLSVDRAGEELVGGQACRVRGSIATDNGIIVNFAANYDAPSDKIGDISFSYMTAVR
jgi:hypothetical protein